MAVIRTCLGCGVDYEVHCVGGGYSYCSRGCYENKKRHTRARTSVGYNEVFYNPKSPYVCFYNPKSPWAQFGLDEKWFNPASPFARKWRQRFDSGQHSLEDVVDALMAKFPSFWAPIAADLRQELAIAVLSQQIPIDADLDDMRQYLRMARSFDTDPRWSRFISLAAPTHTGDGAQTWGERLGLT